MLLDEEQYTANRTETANRKYKEKSRKINREIDEKKEKKNPNQNLLDEEKYTTYRTETANRK